MKSVPENIYLSKELSNSFPGAQTASLSTLIPLSGCWKSAAAAAQDSVSQRQIAKTLLVVVQSLANGLDQCQFVLDRATHWFHIHCHLSQLIITMIAVKFLFTNFTISSTPIKWHLLCVCMCCMCVYIHMYV